MKKVLALFSIGIMAAAIAFTTGFSFFVAAGAVFVGSLLVPEKKEVAYAGLNKEIWIEDIREDFYGDDSWLSELVDMSEWVDNNTINLAEAGVDPDVLINNTSYPISTAQRTDTPLALPLDTYDTTNTKVRSIEIAELKYDKRASILRGHKNSLRMTIMMYGAHRIAPATNTANTPLIATTGANDGSGSRKITFNDLIELERRFDEMEAPAEGRILILSATHKAQLKEEDKAAFKDLMEMGLHSFKVYKQAEKRLPRYNRTNGVKVAWGASAGAEDVRASFAFQKDEVMRALGDTEMFARIKDPEERADIMGFQQRGLVMPIRQKALAAIYSPAV